MDNLRIFLLLTHAYFKYSATALNRHACCRLDTEFELSVLILRSDSYLNANKLLLSLAHTRYTNVQEF